MELDTAKYLSMLILFSSNLLMTLLAMALQKFLFEGSEHRFQSIQQMISSFTSGILLGTLLIVILPNSLHLSAEQWNDQNVGFILIGLGFFIICLIKECLHLYEFYSIPSNEKLEEEQLIVRSPSLSKENQLTRLISLVFSLGVHYFFNGVLIGGQTKDTSTLWLLLAVISFHMSLLAFSVTLRLLIDNGNYLRVFLAMCLWSLMGSLGVYVAFSVSSNSSAVHGINAVLQGLSAGTFLYITFIDMITDDLKKSNQPPFLHLTLIFLGFLILALSTFSQHHPH